MSDIPKAYEPQEVESRWYQQWLDRKAFAGERREGKEPFCVMIPPPNVTGMLHMGHILNNTLQDIFVRRARLEGKAALWFPGTDHAGIATQTMVERDLRKEGKTKHDLGREAFLERVWEWKEKHGGIILNQLRKLGASCDWDRTSFTLDEHYSKAVLTAFVKLYKKGCIYRGQRMVNWCPATQTALSDEEVIPTAQKGKFYKMRYAFVEPTVDHEGKPLTHLEISTTRPETIMGDTAVAVNPKDERYAHLIGKKVYRPFPKEPIPIVGDAYVDMEFGTGCLKVTPAHDTADWEIGQRHNLETIDVLNPDGTIAEVAGMFVGMDRFEARDAAEEELKRLGLLVEAKPYENNVGFSERGKVPIEPRLSEQWFLKYPRVEEAKKAVRDGDIDFHPARWEKTYLHWLENIQDWCISRQLWWGHRIPVWYRKGVAPEDRDYQNPEHVHVSVEGPADPENWEQDPDVLDTWASSNLWPFANFGWPDEDADTKAELGYWYPTSVLVTGFDIIFFWVARMIMAGLDLVDEKEGELSEEDIKARIPFHDVYITGLIRDGEGRKMSKTLGNSPDPLDLIAKFGADAVRFGIVSIAPSGRDILFEFAQDEQGNILSCPSAETGRNFCNKLWNACRFRQMSGEVAADNSLVAITARIKPELLDAWDHWILSRLAHTTAAVERFFANFEMHQLPGALYEFFWTDFCDWYVEVSKSKVQGGTAEQRDTCLAVQDLVLRQTLQLLEPLIPFISEELWHKLGFGGPDSLIQQQPVLKAEAILAEAYKGGDADHAGEVAAIESLKESISLARKLKAEYNLASKRDVKFSLVADDKGAATLERNRETVERLAGAAEIAVVARQPEGAPAAVTPIGTLYLDLASAIDVDAEKDRLGKELEKLEKSIRAGEGKLSNDKFVNNAPAHIVQGARDQLAQTKAKKDELERLLSALG